MKATMLFILLPLIASAEEKKPQPRIVNDAIAAYYHDHLVAEKLQGNLMVVEADFDCDGHKDFAITNSSERGKSGAWWHIYLHRQDSRFTEIGSVGTKANRFHITATNKGHGRLAVMMRGGSGDLAITFYDISHTALKKVREEAVHLSEEIADKNRINEVFGEGYSEQPITSYAFAELQTKFGR